ncbi:uncharacterized protein PV09_08690 [Verruconis gallopava]|uniref:Uncharacterized protein n=1 Tax=Verruconis gallopava TaxID=253628 RepID=A0A0D1XBP6_9PEZI|nr:uncharacterized protein PV09_08690 [Verruconis gallopava]KIV99625.1 hypothetical protein PV09_08690 [Verruconis gallopava]
MTSARIQCQRHDWRLKIAPAHSLLCPRFASQLTTFIIGSSSIKKKQFLPHCRTQPARSCGASACQAHGTATNQEDARPSLSGSQRTRPCSPDDGCQIAWRPSLGTGLLCCSHNEIKRMRACIARACTSSSPLPSEMSLMLIKSVLSWKS